MKDALKHTTNMLRELSGGELYPKNYSQLYMEVFNKLNYLEARLRPSLRCRGASCSHGGASELRGAAARGAALRRGACAQMFLAEHVESGATTYDGLYETVQHAGHVLPRLYLMCITAGSGMKHRPELVPRFLTDLVEMCKGVQHPVRGLFLRSYLCSVAKQYLPDSAGAKGERVGARVEGWGVWKVRKHAAAQRLARHLAPSTQRPSSCRRGERRGGRGAVVTYSRRW